ncbi:unnamed protein product [Periconia digitata]|uniref:alpha-1,2-Mannosidase n=1 Tax=Periconia digitata TaxID=1303443 RepID=A0A9W4XI36_9PLEO|nr:unnamed protein product [Periconia digitata]
MHGLIAFIIGLAGSALATPTPLSARDAQSYPNVTYPGQKGEDYDYTGFDSNQTRRVEAVVEMFRFSWNGYYEYAFPNDDLQPVNNSFANTRNGWGATAIDALSTAIIMQQTDIVNQILDFVPTIDFTKTGADTRPGASEDVSLFETTIRYIGGLLSGYDLLKGPFDHLDVDKDKVDALLTQCAVLADAMKFAFNTTTGIPANNIYINNQTFAPRYLMEDGTRSAGLAELGTLVLEWQHLSDLTGNPEYGELAQKAEDYFLQPSEEVFPGLTGGNFSIETGEILDSWGGWTSGNDSAYEYLIKMYAYDPEKYALYAERFTLAADSTIAHLLSSPSSRPDLTAAGSFAGTQPQNYSEQLACFIGGSFILGSTILSKPSYLESGLDFAEFCANGYRYSPSGIGPVIYSWNTTELAQPQFANQTSLYNKAGWFINDNTAFGGGLTPEAVESWYYAYQVTGNQYWRDVAWELTLAQNRTERVGSGFSSLRNVLAVDGGGWQNRMQSFFLAEVLKYQYLIQAPEELKGEWDVEFAPNGVGEGGNVNPWIYNTEAHPFKVRAQNPV